MANLLQLLVDLARIAGYLTSRPIRLAFRSQQPQPSSQQQLADLVNKALKQQIRAGYSHRFIDLMFVCVGERVFCRRYQYSEPSWHSVFLTNSEGQLTLDKTVINIRAQAPSDLELINPVIDQAYFAALKKMGARFLSPGVAAQRAHQSTLEILLNPDK